HVRAIWKIVRPQLARKELQKKRWLIRRLARGIEAGLIRRIEAVQLLRDHRKRLWPRNRLVVSGVRPPHHRSREPPLLIQPVIRLRRQLLNRILREELRRDPLPCRLVRYRLRAVLAELENLPVFVRTRPRAALAIESRDMVDL